MSFLGQPSKLIFFLFLFFFSSLAYHPSSKLAAWIANALAKLAFSCFSWPTGDSKSLKRFAIKRDGHKTEIRFNSKVAPNLLLAKKARKALCYISESSNLTFTSATQDTKLDSIFYSTGEEERAIGTSGYNHFVAELLSTF